jgi:hypothetical protein
MGKLVEIRLDGRLQDQQPIRVFLSIGEDADRPGEMLPRASFEDIATLPYSPQLCGAIAQWRDSYRNAAAPSRIRPVSVQQISSRPARIAECQDATDQLVHSLHAWLDEPGFRNLENALRDQVLPQEPLRILLRTGDRDLQRLPWQKWRFFDSHPNAECAFSSLRTERVQRQRRSPGKVRILAILGNSEGIDIEADRQMLAALPDADVTFLPKPGETEVQRSDLTSMWQKSWDIIFFAGHTESVDEEDNAILHINRHESMKITELWFALRTAVDKGLQLAIFNSCDGLEISRHLDDAINIPQVIVMRDLVPDRIAQEFLKSFLHFYTQGSPLYVATRRARESLQHLENDYPCASLLPVIFQNPLEIPLNWDHFQDQLHDQKSSNIHQEHNDRNEQKFTDFKEKYNIKNHLQYFLNNKAQVLKWSGLVVVGLTLILPLSSYWVNEYGLLIEENEDNNMTAKTVFELAARLNPRNSKPLINLGILHEERLMMPEAAMSYYAKAHFLGDAHGSTEYARLLIEKDKFDDASSVIHQGLQYKNLDLPKYSGFPVEAALWKNLGHISLKKADAMKDNNSLKEEYLDQAKGSVQKSIILYDESPHAWCLLAQIMEAEGQNTQRTSFAWQKFKETKDETSRQYEGCMTKFLEFQSHYSQEDDSG